MPSFSKPIGPAAKEASACGRKYLLPQDIIAAKTNGYREEVKVEVLRALSLPTLGGLDGFYIRPKDIAEVAFEAQHSL